MPHDNKDVHCTAFDCVMQAGKIVNVFFFNRINTVTYAVAGQKIFYF